MKTFGNDSGILQFKIEDNCCKRLNYRLKHHPFIRFFYCN